MKQSLLSFIWTFSKRDQMILVVATCLLFPLLYLTLELPKRIINDAISADSALISYFGYLVNQKTLLILLCLIFLAAVLAHGLLKMRINTMKGVMAERLLRRFRYTLIEHILRFPGAYQSNTSEGELVSMVTSETEPMGGLMGDAIAHPLLQAGQMLTILLFLFLQSLWFGLAACALIPLQAWLIPRLQRQINTLNRSRIRQVRALASDIGELTTGAATLRQNIGWRYRMAKVSARLGKLFDTRFLIYKRKFFMKFLNNFLNQLTPFMLFLIGGLLVIDGQLTVGALVAALAAFKDLSAPWKELLTYYTAAVEMSQRYELVVGRFTPTGLLSDYLSEAPQDVDDQTETPQDRGLSLEHVILLDRHGHQVLNNVDLEVPKGAWVCLVVENDYDRVALAQMLLREINPSSGNVMFQGANMNARSQTYLSSNLGHVTSKPYIFQGTVRENMMMPALVNPAGRLGKADADEAERTGNSKDASEGDWGTLEGEEGKQDATHADWISLVKDIGAHGILLQRAVERKLNAQQDTFPPQLLASLRADIRQKVRPEEKSLPIFGRDHYSDGLTLPENLLYGIAISPDWLGEDASETIGVLLDDLGLCQMVIEQSVVLGSMLIETFDADATDSLLFQQLGLPENMLAQLHALAKRTEGVMSGAELRPEDEKLLLSLALNVPSSRFDRAFHNDVKAAVLAARDKVPAKVALKLASDFAPLDEQSWHPHLSILDNLVFGKLDELPRTRYDEAKVAITEILTTQVEDASLNELVGDLPTELRGSNLSPQINEIISLAQMVIKKPNTIILDNAMSSYDAAARENIFAKVRRQFPKSTIIQLERETPDDGNFDQILTLQQGGFVGQDGVNATQLAPEEMSELRRKLQAIRKAPLFSGLSGQQLRLLAFSARWVEFPAGTYVFRQNDQSDGAYLIYEGDISLVARKSDGSEDFKVYPPEGTLVGELGLIRNDPRRLDMHADTTTTLLRIQAQDFLAILESDAQTAFKMIRVLIGYLDRPN
ncbi:MAG: cyclic nucleotide-binding domain-containing protein [Paracoccaceae bacterium]